jgi:hypothetical protein
MRKKRVPYSDQVTLVIENDNEIVWFSHAVQAMTYENMIYQLEIRKKQPEDDPLGFEFEEPATMEGVDYYPGFPCDIILVDRYDNVLGNWTEPDFSEINGSRNFSGVKTMLICPQGFNKKSGLIQGVSKLTLRSSMAWAAIYTHEVYAKELRSRSDQEIIDSFNAWVGKGYMGNLGNCTRSAIGKEIFARSFNYSIIFRPGTNGTCDSVSMQKRVKLVENRLEFE